MGAIEEGGKAIGVIADSMKSAPLALALLLVNAAFIAFFGYLTHVVGVNARDRDRETAGLIKALAADCRAAGRPAINFRSSHSRTAPPSSPASPETPSK